MKSKEYYINLFAQLGEMLAGFGADPVSARVISDATAANPWFSTDDIFFAVRSLREDMLQPDTLAQWIQNYYIDYRAKKNVAVIMAGNIPLVGFFDMMCVLAAGHSCYIKPSSKDESLINYVAGLLGELDADIPIFKYSSGAGYDAVIATGSDNTNRYFRSEFYGIPTLLRGSRASAAVLYGSETVKQLRGLSEDVFRYNGAGCRNVSLVFVPEGYDIRQLAEAVSPEGINPKYYNNYLQQRAVLSMHGKTFTDGGSFLLTQERAFPHILSRINYSYYKNVREVSGWLETNKDTIQVVIASEPTLFLSTAGFGQAQHPTPWDYPDGVDVIRFLISLK